MNDNTLELMPSLDQPFPVRDPNADSWPIYLSWFGNPGAAVVCFTYTKAVPSIKRIVEDLMEYGLKNKIDRSFILTHGVLRDGHEGKPFCLGTAAKRYGQSIFNPEIKNVIYTIYDHPKDFPHSFVIKKWYTTKNDMPEQDIDYVFMSPNITDCRNEMTSYGLTLIPRHPEDDPTIVESYI